MISFTSKSHIVMYRNNNPQLIVIIATAIIFLMILLAGCKSKQQAVTEYKSSDSLEVKEVAAVQSTAKATSYTSSLEQMLSSMALNIDSIIIMMPPTLSSDNNGDDSLNGEMAIQAASYLDLASSVSASRSPGDCRHRSEPDLSGRSASDLASQVSSSPLNTHTVRTKPIPQGKIVISGISLNRQSSKAKADITASSDTAAEVRSAETELTSATHQSVQRIEGKPRSSCKFHYYVIAMALAASLIFLMKKFHIFTIITKVIKKIFS